MNVFLHADINDKVYIFFFYEDCFGPAFPCKETKVRSSIYFTKVKLDPSVKPYHVIQQVKTSKCNAE